MRRLYFFTLALMAMVTGFTAQSQTSVLTEGFESTSFPPPGWVYVLNSGTSGWLRTTTGSWPTCSPHSGGAMASYNSFSISLSGANAIMGSPAITFPSGSFVEFWMYRDVGYSGSYDLVNVLYNASAPSATGATTLGTINRYKGFAPVETGVDGWYKYTFNLPSTGGTNGYVIFQGVSQWGNNIFVDDINVYYMCSAPAGLVASAVLQNSATLSWGAVPSSAGYEYVLDYTAANPAGAGTPTTATSLNFTGLNSGTVYYMHLRNKCISGATSSWVTTSFVTPGGPACNGVTGLSATPATSTVVNLSWGAVPASVGYVYVIDKSPNDPVTGYVNSSNNNIMVTGLTPLTNYYAHVRNVCSNNLSAWSTVPFTTPQCEKPNNILYTSITNTSVDMLWSMMPNVQQYEYKVDLTPTGYNNPLNFVITSSITATVGGLLPGTKYYVFLRSRCFSGADSSQWKIDSFVTTTNCGVPELQIANQGSNSPTGSWSPIANAISYEYAVSDYSTPPSFGIDNPNTSVTVNLPSDNKAKYMHVRSKCNSQFSFSGWATALLRGDGTTGINDVAGKLAIQVYPNPVKDVLTVEVSAMDKNATLILTDITGKLLQTVSVVNNKTTVDVSNLVPGIYMMRYSDDSHNEVIRVNKK